MINNQLNMKIYSLFSFFLIILFLFFSGSIYGKSIPNLQGMGIKDVLFLLENSGLKVKFFGKGTIKNQSLKKGKRFKNGSEITLELA